MNVGEVRWTQIGRKLRSRGGDAGQRMLEMEHRGKLMDVVMEEMVKVGVINGRR